MDSDDSFFEVQQGSVKVGNVEQIKMVRVEDERIDELLGKRVDGGFKGDNSNVGEGF